MVGKIKFTRVGEDPWCLPTRQHEDDAGFDLAVSRYVQVFPGQIARLSTGIAVAIPKGFFGMIIGRSSTLFTRGLNINTGIIDSGYRGEVCIMVQNPTNNAISIASGDRLAQLLILPTQEWEFTFTADLPEGSRGKAGFGSTGA